MSSREAPLGMSLTVIRGTGYCTTIAIFARSLPVGELDHTKPRMPALEFGLLCSTAKQKPARASCAPRRRSASLLTAASPILDEIEPWSVI